MNICLEASQHSKSEKGFGELGMWKVLESNKLDEARIQHQQPTWRPGSNLPVKTTHALYFLLERGHGTEGRDRKLRLDVWRHGHTGET